MKLKILDYIENNDLDSNFLQTKKWAELKKNEGWNYYFLNFYKKDFVGYALLLERNEKMFKIHYIPRGPILKNITDLKEVLELIQNFSKEHKASFLKIEPNYEYSKENLIYFENFIESHKSYQPIDTAIIHLEEDLIKNIPSKKRGRIRNKQNLIFRETQDLEKFYNLYKKTFENKNFKGRSLSYFKDMKKYFKEDLKIFEVLSEDHVIASSINIIHQDMITYLYSGSDSNFNNFYPGYILLYNTALFAQEKGLKYFDLWGISYTNKKWAGFSEFKFNMGGKPFKFIGSFDYPINKILYKIYSKLK